MTNTRTAARARGYGNQGLPDAPGATKGARATPSAPHMPERQLQDLVRRTALAFGFDFYHTQDSRRSDPGFPDCVMLKGSQLHGEPTRLVVAELKAERGKVTVAQQGWLDRFRELPDAEVFVWRPSHWLSGRIEEILRGEG